MSRARTNPRGLPVPGGRIVLVGKYGLMTHLVGSSGKVLCRSGKGAGRYPRGATAAEKKEILAVRLRSGPTLYPSKAKKEGVTCYRCAKLALINQAAGRSLWGEPGV